MATKIVTKNSSTASAAPTASDLVQGELAVNVTDKRLYTENASGAIVELGTSPSTIDINAGTIDGTVIGGASASTGAFTTLSASGEITANGGIALGDNDIATFGDSDDLQIYHDGEHSYVSDTGIGYLKLKGSNYVQIMDASNAVMANFESGGAVYLSHNGADRFATTSTGIDVTGISVSDGMSTNTLGTSNFRAGVNAGNSIASGGNYNVVVGDEAGTAISTGDNNVAVGYNALASEDTGSANTAIGRYALSALNNDAISYNTAVGFSAGAAVTTGVRNTLIGGIAGDALTDADDNVVLGYQALSNDTLGSRTIAIGKGALTTQNFTSATDTYNTAMGYNAGNQVTTGVQNTFVGGLAGDALDVGSYNIAIGMNALTTDTKGSKSVAMGYDALGVQNFTSATDSFNTAIGHGAGRTITTGVQNTFVGGKTGDGTDDGSYNTAVGYLALSANCADQNTAFGENALSQTTGATNTAVGAAAGYEVSSGANNCFLGQQAGRAGSPGGSITTASNILTLGNTSIATANIQVDWTVASDARDKTDFTALDLGLDFVKALAPVTYKWDKRASYGDNTADDYDLAAQNPDGTHKEDWLDIGFKAQEVEALEIAAGYNKSSKTNLISSHASDGKSMGLQYSKFVPILVKAIQEQNALIEALTARIETLEG